MWKKPNIEGEVYRCDGVRDPRWSAVEVGGDIDRHGQTSGMMVEAKVETEWFG